jgi:predicted transcriptional regulator
MSVAVKVHVPLGTDYQIREIARKTGRPISEVCLRAIERGLDRVPATLNDAAVVDVAERGKGATTAAAYLSGPLASAVRKLALEQDRSQSWTVRDLLRVELRRRGLLPTPVDTALEVAG